MTLCASLERARFNGLLQNGLSLRGKDVETPFWIVRRARAPALKDWPIRSWALKRPGLRVRALWSYQPVVGELA